jgi:hypothetical protein
MIISLFWPSLVIQIVLANGLVVKKSMIAVEKVG